MPPPNKRLASGGILLYDKENKGDMVMHYQFTPHGVCSSRIRFNIQGGVVTDIVFSDGCNGSLKTIAKLMDGKTADEIAQVLGGIDCHQRGTSCADQLAIAVRRAAEKEIAARERAAAQAEAAPPHP